MVWVLVLANWHGGTVTIDNIRSWDDCERLRKRAEAVRSPNNGQMFAGTCTEIGILVPKAAPPVVNVQPTVVPAPVVQNRVIIRKDK